MDIDLSFLAGDVEGLSSFFTSLAQSERSKEADEYRDNPAEAAAMDAEIAATKFVVSFSGNTVTGEIITSGSLYDGVSTEGKGEAYIGGSGGIVTDPDGSTRMSNVPPQLWGTSVVEGSAEPSSPWKENVMTMVESLLPGLVGDVMNAHRQEIAEAAKPEIAEMLGGVFS